MNEYSNDPLNEEIKEETPAEGKEPVEKPAEPQKPAQNDTPSYTGQPYRPPYQQPYRPAQPPYGASGNGYQPPYGASPYRPNPPRPVKTKKPVTAGALAGTVAIALILSLFVGLCGGFFGARLAGNQQISSGGNTVIYRSAKLQDADGNELKSAMSITEVADLVKNSVVEITTEARVQGIFMQQYITSGAGSGVIITADGYIVTNNHVIEDATSIKVTLADGTEYEAKLVATDEKADLAVIKIEATGLTPAAYGSSSELKVGETVVAVGNPLGELGGTVTSGIVSALEREMTIENTTMYLLQTDTAINPGNSGGGLFNTSGQLVGIVNAKASGEEIEGLGFAIPIDTASAVIKDLIENGYVTGRVNPGLSFVEINDAMTAMMYQVSDLGVYISSVESGSDAATAGFRGGDLLISIDGKEIQSAAAANAALDDKKPGDTAVIVIKRDGSQQTVTMTLTEYKPSFQTAVNRG